MTTPTDNRAALDALERIETFIDDCETMCVEIRDDLRLVEKHIRFTQEPIDLGEFYDDGRDGCPCNKRNDLLNTLKQKYPERFK